MQHSRVRAPGLATPEVVVVRTEDDMSRCRFPGRRFGAGRLALEDSSLTLYLEVLNLYGRKNVCCVDDVRFSPEANGEVRVDRTYGYWLGRIPSFGLRWEF